MTDERVTRIRDWLRGSWRSWTVRFNTLAPIAVAAMLDPTVQALVRKTLGERWYLWVAAITALVNILLRFKTSVPLAHR